MKTVYQCEVCGSTYETEYYAKQCEASEPPPKPDIIVGKNYRTLGGEHFGPLKEIKLIALKTNNHINYDSEVEYYVGHKWMAVFDHPLQNNFLEQWMISPNQLTDKLLID